MYVGWEDPNARAEHLQYQARSKPSLHAAHWVLLAEPALIELGMNTIDSCSWGTYP